jgi:hypothetical protein
MKNLRVHRAGMESTHIFIRSRFVKEFFAPGANHARGRKTLLYYTYIYPLCPK